ncbi:MarR family transcriptional regulator [Gordonia sp. DT30]|uniref:MarR family transcriptional regulator n=1 Tax=unclassified Gordonia (in: high G+C Gram-positive bacteria) TaxID=2657482 RepID=UPI003CEDC192
MDHPKLTPSQSAVLFVLMAESRALSTPQLRALGPNLDKPGRELLARHGLIESVKGARGALFHSLTDRGWAWCATELPDGPPARSQPPIRAMYAVLAGLGRYLDAEDLRLHEVFGRPRPEDTSTHATPAPATDDRPATDLRGIIVETYYRLAPVRGALVDVARLRTAITGHSRAAFDAAIVELEQQRGVSLIPQDDRARLTAGDHAAAVMVGTQPCHLFAIEEA